MPNIQTPTNKIKISVKLFNYLIHKPIECKLSAMEKWIPLSLFINQSYRNPEFLKKYGHILLLRKMVINNELFSSNLILNTNQSYYTNTSSFIRRQI